MANIYILIRSPVSTLKTETDMAARLKNSLARTVKADIALGSLPDHDHDYDEEENDADGEDEDGEVKKKDPILAIINNKSSSGWVRCQLPMYFVSRLQR